MKITPPRDARARRALLVAASLALLALALWGKARWIGPFVSARAVASVGLAGAFVLALVAVGALLRERPATTLFFGVPALVALLFALVQTPMTYEMAAFTARLPRPEGADIEEVRVLRPFAVNHPSARVVFVYPEGSNLTALSDEARAAFEREGWRVRASLRPGDANAGHVVDYGYVLAERWGFRASCALGDAPRVTMSCTTTV